MDRPARRPRLVSSPGRRPHPEPGRQRRPVRQRTTWKFGEIPVLGVVGGIGAGKSAVAGLLAARGALVLDADAIGHALIDQRPCRDQVMERFGFGVVAPASEDGPYIDRKALGAIVFGDRRARRDLEAILHPRMRSTVERAIARAERRGRDELIALDAALLFEAGWDDLCDRVLYVDAPHAVRLSRLSQGRGWTIADLDAREAAQLPASETRARCGATVANDGTIEALDARLAEALGLLLGSPPPPRRPDPGPRELPPSD